MLDLRLYLLQRLSALARVPLVIGHLAVMVYAIRGGLSAAEILSRTRDSVGWAAFYEVFVVAVAIHAAIGLCVIAHETLAPGRAALRALGWGAFLGLLGLGSWAVWAVTFGATP